MRAIAKKKLIAAGTEKPSEEEITATASSLDDADVRAYANGQLKQELVAREKAADTYGARLRARFKETDEAVYKENDAGGTVFDQGMAEQVQYQNSVASAQALMDIVSGNIKSLPTHIKDP
jgi:phage tail tube protein FII